MRRGAGTRGVYGPREPRIQSRRGGVDIPSMTGDGSRARACLPLLLVVGMLVGLVPSSSAGPQARLDRARAQLGDLTSRISQLAAEEDDLRAQVEVADRRITTAEHALGLLLGSRLQVRAELEVAQQAYDDALARTNQAVVDEFISSPGSSASVNVLGAFLDARSVGELQDQLAFGDAIVAERERSATRLARAQAVLTQRGRVLDGALAAQRATLDALQQAREERVSALAGQQDTLAALGTTRDQIVTLIAHLRNQLQPADVGDVARAFQGAAHVSYGDWADLLLKVLGAPTCRDNRVVVVSWQVQEFTQAAWNPLATTHRLPGSTGFNSVGVQNYVSLQQGLQATDETIANGWDAYGYGAIVRSLRACAPALTTASAIAGSSWCPGCLNGMYVVGVVPKVQADFETYASL